ncbi:transcriptional activator of cad operon [Izhakiella capsodis]|uniref:Transcriptional activator of cad operon n=1 Tax=Izhakiella capsodis TaxID=1367852 RepID=A0A1I4VXD0_9GAMM|nr:lysine decarboxylation/transport transcriptional activator CadC [Izhakiella capsodis]SFN05901.1 transcriptional activator of cad operon [Izhakiella capsodis]
MQQSVVRVGKWLVTPSVNQITLPDRVVTLEPRLIDLLVFFAHHPDVVLSRDELIDSVWTRNIVTNHVVTQSISELRKSLKDGDEDNVEYIITVPKRGYKLVAPVIWCTDEANPGAPDSSGSTDALQPAVHVAVASIATATPTFPVMTNGRQKKITPILVWLLFIISLISCVTLVALSSMSGRSPQVKTLLMLNPRDIDVRLLNGDSCNEHSLQYPYAVGIGDLITTSLNTYSTFMVHDRTNYNVNEPDSSGKTLTIEFVNQRHYRSQQCFMSVKLIDNGDSSVMLDKRYFITNDNQLSILKDLLNNLSTALAQPWPTEMQKMLDAYLPKQGMALARFYDAHQLLLKGDADSLSQASDILAGIIKQWPDYTWAYAEKALVDTLRYSQQPSDDSRDDGLQSEINQVTAMPQINGSAIYYQIKTIDYLEHGKVNDAYAMINLGIGQEMSWLNYVLLGKVYEMKGDNRQAADAYLTGFNLRPGADTLNWIENSVFQTSIQEVAPYLMRFNIK